MRVESYTITKDDLTDAMEVPTHVRVILCLLEKGAPIKWTALLQSPFDFTPPSYLPWVNYVESSFDDSGNMVIKFVGDKLPAE